MGSFLERLKAKPETLAIASLGGLGYRGFSDKHSDIDMSLLVDSPANWMPQFEFYIPRPGTEGFFEINIHQNTLERERARSWEEAKKEAYDEARIIYDPTGALRNLIDQQVAFDEMKAGNRRSLLLDAIFAFSSTGDGLNDHLALNKMCNQVIELVYLANHEFRPHKKWRLEKARYLKKVPRDFDRLITMAMTVTSMHQKSVRSRLSSLRRLAEDYSVSTGLNPSQSCVDRISGETADLLTILFGQFMWYAEVNPPRQVERGFFLNAHDLLNEGLSMVLEASRLMRGVPMRQHLDALDIGQLHPSYREEEYNLYEDVAVPGWSDCVMDALFTVNLSAAEVTRRAQELNEIITALRQIAEETDAVPRNAYHHALANCYYDRQLLSRTFGENICSPNLPPGERKLFLGYLSYNLIESIDQLEDALGTFSQIYTDRHKETIKTITETLMDTKARS